LVLANVGGRAVGLSGVHRTLCATWQFRLLHLAGFLVGLPVVAAIRMLPAHWHELYDESVIVETNRAVLTALGFAFMA
jgi:hypothetical protein